MRASLALAGDLRKFAVESCRGKWMERCAFVNESVLHSVVFLPAFCPIWICSWNLKKLSRFQNCAGVEYSFGGIGGMGLASLWNTHPSTDCADAETRCKWFANVRHAMSCDVMRCHAMSCVVMRCLKGGLHSLLLTPLLAVHRWGFCTSYAQDDTHGVGVPRAFQGPKLKEDVLENCWKQIRRKNQRFGTNGKVKHRSESIRKVKSSTNKLLLRLFIAGVLVLLYKVLLKLS